MKDLTRGRQALVLTTLGVAVSVVLLGTTILNVALPALNEQLQTTNTQQQWILNAYTLAFAGFLLVSGAIGDRYGLRRTLLAGLAGFAIATAISAFATSPTLLIAMRGLSGVFAAAIMPVSLAIIVRTFPRDRVAGAISVWAAISGVSIALGPLIGGALIDAGFWWGSVLMLIAVLTAVGLILAATTIPDPEPSGGGARLRLSPVIYSILGIGLLVWGVIDGGRQGNWGAPRAVLPIVAGSAVLALLVVTEARHRAPLADVRLLAKPRFAVAVTVLTLGSFSVYGFLYFSTFYIQVQRGYSPLQAGLVLLPLAAGLVIGGLVSPRIAARFGASPTMTVGMSVTAIAMGLLAMVGQHTPIAVFMALAFVLAIGFAMVLAPGTALAISEVPAGREGAGSALVNTLRQLGSTLGVAILGSALWGSYRSHIEQRLAALPDHSSTAASSLADTLAAAGSDADIAGAAHESFTSAMQFTTIIGAAIATLAAVSVPTVELVLRRRQARAAEGTVVTAVG
ncbi:MFS transporter [Rhodococcus hoagii]|nr:MFS transporter [Prescottella equi]